MATLYAGWVDNNRIYFNKSTDDGEVWGTPATVDDGVTANITRHSPKIQLDAEGDVYVAWVKKNTSTLLNQLKINHTADGGSTWSGVTTVSDLTGTAITSYIGFIVDAGGYLWIFFGRTGWSAGLWYYKSTNVKDQTVWNNEVKMTLGLEPASQIECCVGDDNWIWIVYLNGGDIRCHRYDGTRWIRQADVETVGTLTYPSIYAEGHHVFVAYYDGTNSKIRKRHNGGWQAAVTIAAEKWPSIGGCELWAATVGTTASMEVNQRDSNDAGATWGAASEKSHGEGDAENITGGRGVNYAHTPYYIFVTTSHKVFVCKGVATE